MRCAGYARGRLRTGAELAVGRAPQEGIPLGGAEDPRRSVRVPGVAHGHLPAGEGGHLPPAASGGGAGPALGPADAVQVGGGHAVADVAHDDPSKSVTMARRISAESPGGALMTLSLSMASRYRPTSTGLSM